VQKLIQEGKYDEARIRSHDLHYIQWDAMVAIDKKVQQLIQEGKYDEARIRSHDLRYSWDAKDAIDKVDKAENSRRPTAQRTKNP
jgi:hypothetical protein